MAHTHEFDCKVCGAHLDTRQDLDQHNREKHPNQTRTGQSNINSASGSSSNQSRPQS